MRILYLIGNGFDLNLGMNTRYIDFYNYYQTVKARSNVVIELKERISADLKNWSDLEIAFGQHTQYIKTTEDFDVLYADLEDNLADYLHKQVNKFDFSKIDTEKFYKDLIYPESHLTQADKLKINEIRKNKSSNANIIDIVTFNYTESIESILGEQQSDILLKSNSNNPTKLTGVEHIHGYLDNRMVLGVNDISQISNMDFHSNQDVLETLIKIDCNKTSKHNIDLKCKSLIKAADLICIFGCSLGATDNFWWNLIGDQFKRQAALIIYEKGEKIPARRSQLIGRREREIKDYFIAKTNLDDNEKENAN